MEKQKQERQYLACPILRREIEYGYCFEISMVSEGLIKVQVLPQEVQDVLNFKEICLKCRNHCFN